MRSTENGLLVASSGGIYRIDPGNSVSEVAALPSASALSSFGTEVWGASRESGRVVRVSGGVIEEVVTPTNLAPEDLAADADLVVVGGRGLYVGAPGGELESIVVPQPFGIDHGYDDEVPATVHAVALTETHAFATTFYGGYIAMYERKGSTLGAGELLTLRPLTTDDDWDEDSYGDVVGWDPTQDTGLTRLKVNNRKLYVSSAVWGYVGATDLDTGSDAAIQEGDGGVSQLGGAYSFALSGDSKHLYVGAWNNPEPSGWVVDQTTSTLTALPAVSGAPQRPVNYGTPDVAIPGDGGQVFAIDDQFNRLHVYDRDTESGRLQWRAELADEVPLELLVALAAAPDGRAVWVSDFEADTLVSFSRTPETGEVVVDKVFVEGVDGIVGLAGAEDVVPSPDNRHVYVVAFKSQGVSVWERTEMGLVYSGLYQAPTEAPDDDGMYGVEAAAVTKDGTRMVVISPVRDRVFVLDRDAETGGLTQRQRYSFDALYGSVPLANRQADPGRVAISDDGSRVYLSLRRWNAVGALSMADDDGALRWEHTWTAPEGSNVLTWPNGVQLSAKGDLWVASLLGDSVITLTVRDSGSNESDGCGGLCP
jgi:hypothetical protein